VLDLIAGPEDRQWVTNTADEGLCWDRLPFSIKESVYTVWYPLEHCWLDFHQARVEIDAGGKIFRATLDRSGRVPTGS
jgi:4'-phosphopantetheinyl transferase EntD